MTEAEKQELLELDVEHERITTKRSLAKFTRKAWPLVEPNDPYVHGWHIDAICEHLEAVVRGDIRNLLINIPPRHMKSSLVSVLLPAWVWIESPGMRWLFSSYAETLSVRDSVKCRRLIESEWYKKEFRIGWSLSSDQNAKTRFDNTRQGYRIATSVGGVATGEGGDFIVCDDPHKATEASSDTVRKGVLEWWDQEMSSRANDPKTVRKIIIMQRLHEDDLSGHVLSGGSWEHLCLPAEYEEGQKKATSIGWTDPRKREGELLWPERFGPAEITELKKDLGSQGTAGQLQQHPSPKSGLIFKREWWKYYRELPGDLDTVIQSWDLSFDEGENTSFVVGQVWGKRGANKYLIDQFRARIRFTGQVQAFENMSAKHPQAEAKLVEKKANGAALIDTLKKKISGIIAVEPRGSKVLRAESVSPQVESGNVYLPDPSIAPWIGDYVEELSIFPNGKNDDQVDATSQALQRLASKGNFDWAPISVTKTSVWK